MFHCSSSTFHRAAETAVYSRNGCKAAGGDGGILHLSFLARVQFASFWCLQVNHLKVDPGTTWWSAVCRSQRNKSEMDWEGCWWSSRLHSSLLHNLMLNSEHCSVQSMCSSCCTENTTLQSTPTSISHMWRGLLSLVQFGEGKLNTFAWEHLIQIIILLSLVHTQLDDFLSNA